MPTYFISGPLNITEEDFNLHYKEKIDKAIAEGASFVVGDAQGTDTLAQLYLMNKGVEVTVYHMFSKPRFNSVTKNWFPMRGGFKHDEQRDHHMTKDSDVDIAWVRTVEEQKALYGANYRPRVSGTEKNVLRRQSNSV